MNPESIPKLRVIDNSGGRSTPASAPSEAAPVAEVAGGEAVAKAKLLSWPLVLLFILGALTGGAAVAWLAA